MQVLHDLRDIPGVYGSFVIADSGQMIGRDLPSVFEDGLLSHTGSRIVRLCETLENGGDPLEHLTLRFTEYRLHVRRAPRGLLCVIASETVNVPALRMALSLVARRLPIPGPAAESEPPRTLRSSQTPSAAPPPVAASHSTYPPVGAGAVTEPARPKPVRTYRGRPV